MTISIYTPALCFVDTPEKITAHSLIWKEQTRGSAHNLYYLACIFHSSDIAAYSVMIPLQGCNFVNLFIFEVPINCITGNQ